MFKIELNKEEQMSYQKYRQKEINEIKNKAKNCHFCSIELGIDKAVIMKDENDITRCSCEKCAGI